MAVLAPWPGNTSRGRRWRIYRSAVKSADERNCTSDPLMRNEVPMVAQRGYATNVTLYFLPVDVRNQIHVLRVFPVGPFVRVKKYAVRVRYYVSAVFSLSPMFVTKAISAFFNYWVPFVCTTGGVFLFSFLCPNLCKSCGSVFVYLRLFCLVTRIISLCFYRSFADVEKFEGNLKLAS